MTEPRHIKPLGQAAVVAIVEEEQKAGDLYVPQTTGGLSVAVVVSLPASHDRLPVGVTKELSPGDHVLFDKNAGEAVTIGSDRYIVPLHAIVAVINRPDAPPAPGALPFFDIPEWHSYVEDDASHKTWSEWENVQHFTFRIRFLEPFCPLAPLAQKMYEYGTQEICPHLDTFSAMELEVREKKEALLDS